MILDTFLCPVFHWCSLLMELFISLSVYLFVFNIKIKCALHLDAVYTFAHVLTSMVYIVFHIIYICDSGPKSKCQFIRLNHHFKQGKLKEYTWSPHMYYNITNGSTWMQKYYTGFIYQPKQGTCKSGEIPQNYHTFAAGLIPPKMDPILIIPAIPRSGRLIGRRDPVLFQDRPTGFCRQFKV